MDNRSYFEEAQADANELYFNADGFGDGYGDANVETNFPADGGMGGNGVPPTSQPYIIQVQNTSASAVADVKVLGSYKNLFGAVNFNNPTAIILSSGIPNVTYIQMLQQFSREPFVVGLTYIQSTNTSQVLETMTIRHQDANGNLQDYTMIPTVDPYQEQNSIIPNGFNFRVNGYTELTINSIAANTTVTYRFYPKTKADLSLGTVGRSVERTYANPHILKAQPVAIEPGSTAL